MSLLIDQKITHTTSSHDKVYLDTLRGRRALFLENYHFKECVNPSQINHIINDIVVNNGFMMDSHRNDIMVFTHPHNTEENQTYYNLYVKTSEVEKVSRTFLRFV